MVFCETGVVLIIGFSDFDGFGNGFLVAFIGFLAFNGFGVPKAFLFV